MEDIASDCGISDDAAYGALEELTEWGSCAGPMKKDEFNTYRASAFSPTRKQLRAAQASGDAAPASYELGEARPVPDVQVLSMPSTRSSTVPCRFGSARSSCFRGGGQPPVRHARLHRHLQRDRGRSPISRDRGGHPLQRRPAAVRAAGNQLHRRDRSGGLRVCSTPRLRRRRFNSASIVGIVAMSGGFFLSGTCREPVLHGAHLGVAQGHEPAAHSAASTAAVRRRGVSEAHA